MSQLDPNDPIKARLQRLCFPISKISQSCVETIFGKVCTLNDDWLIVDRLRGDFPHNICLGCGSDEYQALAAFGTGDREITELIGTIESNEILDAFGEMLNTCFAMLMDDEQFIVNFGVLTQSIPQYSADMNFYPSAWGCHGTLSTPQNGSLYIGFAIKSNMESSH